MKNNQHRATQNGFDAEKAPKKYNNLNNAGKYKRKYEQKPFKPKKKQHVDKVFVRLSSSFFYFLIY